MTVLVLALAPAPPGSSRLRANTPTPSPTAPLLRTGSAGTGPSRSRREHRAGWPQRKSAGSGTYRDPMTARLGAVRHICKTGAEWVCSADLDKSLGKSLPCSHVRSASKAPCAATTFRAAILSNRARWARSLTAPATRIGSSPICRRSAASRLVVRVIRAGLRRRCAQEFPARSTPQTSTPGSSPRAPPRRT